MIGGYLTFGPSSHAWSGGTTASSPNNGLDKDSLTRNNRFSEVTPRPHRITDPRDAQPSRGRIASFESLRPAPQEAIADIIYNGKRPMPAYGGIKFKKLRITDDEIRGIAGYVLRQAQAGWPAE